MAGGKKQIINFSLSRLCVTRFYHKYGWCGVAYTASKSILPFTSNYLHGRVPVGGGCALIGLGSDSTQNDLELKRLRQSKSSNFIQIRGMEINLPGRKPD
jgi:hypothetical protein